MADYWRQSERGAVYRAALDRLVAMGAAYPCFCTRADIAAAARENSSLSLSGFAPLSWRISAGEPANVVVQQPVQAQPQAPAPLPQPNPSDPKAIEDSLGLALDARREIQRDGLVGEQIYGHAGVQAHATVTHQPFRAPPRPDAGRVQFEDERLLVEPARGPGPEFAVQVEADDREPRGEPVDLQLREGGRTESITGDHVSFLPEDG